MRKHLCEWCEGRIDCLVDPVKSSTCHWLRSKFVPPFYFYNQPSDSLGVELFASERVFCTVLVYDDEEERITSNLYWPSDDIPDDYWCLPYPFPV